MGAAANIKVRAFLAALALIVLAGPVTQGSAQTKTPAQELADYRAQMDWLNAQHRQALADGDRRYAEDTLRVMRMVDQEIARLQRQVQSGAQGQPPTSARPGGGGQPPGGPGATSSAGGQPSVSRPPGTSPPPAATQACDPRNPCPCLLNIQAVAC
jgi:hypothetical protein